MLKTNIETNTPNVIPELTEVNIERTVTIDSRILVAIPSIFFTEFTHSTIGRCSGLIIRRWSILRSEDADYGVSYKDCNDYLYHKSYYNIYPLICK